MSKRAVIKWDSAGEPYVEIIDLSLSGPQEIAPRLWYTPDSAALPEESWNRAVVAQLAKLKDLYRYFGLPGTVGPDALCELELRDDGRLTPRAFAGAMLNGKKDFVHLRGDLPKDPLSSFDQLHTTSGLCLGSGTGLIARTASGAEHLIGVQATSKEIQEPIVDLEFDPRISLYAYDSTATLAPWNVALARAGLAGGLDAFVNADIPGFGHYGEYPRDNLALQAELAGGRLPDSAIAMFGEFADNVHLNRTDVVQLFWAALRDGLGGDGGQVKIINRDQLKDIGAFLRQQINTGKVPAVDQIARVLFSRRAKDPLLRALLTIAPPRTVKEFTGLLYAYVVLLAAMTIGDGPRKLCVCVENDTEGPILAAAQRLFQLLKQVTEVSNALTGMGFPGMWCNALGIYVRGHVFPYPNGPVDGRLSVYAHAPAGLERLRFGNGTISSQELVRMTH